MILGSILIGGFVAPTFALVTAWINVVFRVAYAIGYMTIGPKGRYFGIVLSTGSVAVLLLYTVGKLSYDIYTKS